MVCRPESRDDQLEGNSYRLGYFRVGGWEDSAQGFGSVDRQDRTPSKRLHNTPEPSPSIPWSSTEQWSWTSTQRSGGADEGYVRVQYLQAGGCLAFFERGRVLAFFVGFERPGWRQAVVKGWMRIVGLGPLTERPVR